jgi:integrase
MQPNRTKPRLGYHSGMSRCGQQMGYNGTIDDGGVVTDVTSPGNHARGGELARTGDLNLVRDFVRVSKAASTIRGYQSDWRHFAGWCKARGASALPAEPDQVAAYIAECAGWLKPGSIQRRLNAIAEAHKAMGQESPTWSGIVRNTFKGIRRTLGTAPNQKTPALTDDIRAMVDAADTGLMGARDRALILVGFAGAFRRSELVGLDVDDISPPRDEGITILLRRSKTDQEGVGRKIGIPRGKRAATCPVRALQAWILYLNKSAGGVASGPLFRGVSRHGRLKARRLSGIDVARVVKKLADRVGLDAKKYSGHSLRSGHATSASIGGASEREIMNQTGHKSVEMVRRYIRDTNLFRGNSGGKVGL